MCGFLGEYCFEKEKLTNDSSFKELLKLSHHRGPDFSLTVENSYYQLGFNRLAILDLSTNGNQPKKSPSGRYHLVFNGEIYNYKELISQYQLENLSSSSDTEVLSSLLDLLGVKKTITQLNGMFAITIIDTNTKKIYLSRDFSGIKPHFYGFSKKGVVSASQFDQVYKHSWLKENLKLRVSSVKEYFGLGYMQAPNTIYENIHQVCPGEMVIYNREGVCVKHTFHSFSKTQRVDKKTVKTNSLNYLDKLKKIIKRQIVSDVPIGTFLSGGIDSPLISGIAYQQNKGIEAYTVGVDHYDYDESEKATEYAKSIGIKQHIITLSEKEILHHIDDHFQYYPEPFGDYSSIPTYLICKKAKENCTVMLSGDGGDELFFGYPRMMNIMNHKGWFKIPFIIRKIAIRLSYKLGITKTLGPYYYKNLKEWVLAKHLQIFPNDLDKIMPGVSINKETLDLYNVSNKERGSDLIHKLRENEFYAHMQRILIKVDRASMGNSLEVRVPFLDKESVNFAWNYLPKELSKKRDLKRLLKDALASMIPENIIEKEKKGFTIPIGDWLKGQLREDLEKVVFKESFYGDNIINAGAVRNYVRNYLDGKHHNSWGVWHIYAWQKWALIHVD